MSELDKIIATQGLVIPEIITGHIAGESVGVDSGAAQQAVYFPGTGEQIAVLQEDDAASVANAVATAKKSFEAGTWSRASTASRQAIFREAARLIRTHAEEL
ncbi:MAG: aldehyde dehydrogenase family protein, partial [Halieaceae bacterium]